MARRIPESGLPAEVPGCGENEGGRIRLSALPAYQGSPRSETTQSNSRDRRRQFTLKSHGWYPKDWVPVEKRREDWYPVRLFVPTRNRLFQ